jgi:hypothetical protein
MTGTFMDLLNYVTVAVKFDHHTPHLVAAAVALCQRTGKRLCLLHVTPEGPEGAEARAAAVSRLQALASMAPPEISVSSRVACGHLPEQIGTEALAVGSCLLLVGVDFARVRALPRRQSTALALLSSSPVPVTALDGRRPAAFAGGGRRILLADDLGLHSEAAVDFAFSLGAALGGTEVRHVHVARNSEGSNRPEMEAALLAIMEDRATAGGRDYLEAAGGRYQPEVRPGDVAAGLDAAAAAAEPEVIVFGRHHAYYTDPFSIGHLPFRSMLALERPIIVVPNE